jgi:hypothetical protein
VCSSDLNHNNNNILEIGAGNGGWMLTLYDIGLTQPNWYLVEDFSWANQTSNEKKWSSNKDALINQVRSHDPNIKLIEIFDKFKKTDLIYDVIRIDCLLDPDQIEEFILLNTHISSWIFIDDCKINCGFERLALAFRLMFKGIIFPVWIGLKECIFSRNAFDGNIAVELLKHLPEHHVSIYKREESYHMDKHVLKYVVTTDFEIPGDKKLCI